jgi:HEAT repeat protein
MAIAVLIMGMSRKQPDDPMYWIERLKTGTEKERIGAICTLAAVRPKSSEIVAALYRATSDANDNVRFQAVGALESCRQDWPLAETAVRRALTDKNEDVRLLAAAIIQGRVIKHGKEKDGKSE